MIFLRYTSSFSLLILTCHLQDDSAVSLNGRDVFCKDVFDIWCRIVGGIVVGSLCLVRSQWSTYITPIGRILYCRVMLDPRLDTGSVSGIECLRVMPQCPAVLPHPGRDCQKQQHIARLAYIRCLMDFRAGCCGHLKSKVHKTAMTVFAWESGVFLDAVWYFHSCC